MSKQGPVNSSSSIITASGEIVASVTNIGLLLGVDSILYGGENVSNLVTDPDVSG